MDIGATTFACLASQGWFCQQSARTCEEIQGVMLPLQTLRDTAPEALFLAVFLCSATGAFVLKAQLATGRGKEGTWQRISYGGGQHRCVASVSHTAAATAIAAVTATVAASWSLSQEGQRNEEGP